MDQTTVVRRAAPIDEDDDASNEPMAVIPSVATASASSSAPAAGSSSSGSAAGGKSLFSRKPNSAAVSIHSSDPGLEFDQLMRIYYSRLFPFKKYYRWLSYGNVQKHYFCNREFSFTLEGDIYVRYQSFSTEEQLRKEIIQRNPIKIDIGAVYNVEPKDHKQVRGPEFKAEEKEVVFDIDMTDYDDIRTCCKGADICFRCWPFMTIAVRILDRALRDDFGFKSLLWIYSGRRGVHCWVCDNSVRTYDSNIRTVLTDYLSVVKGSEKNAKKVALTNPLHPSLQKSLDIIEEYWEPVILGDQDILRSPAHIDRVLATIPDEDNARMRQALRNEWNTHPNGTSQERWKQLVQEVYLSVKAGKSYLKSTVPEIMFQFAYPRLDVEVTKGVNHLLKSPFCVHPKTGRVCVPMDVDSIDDFDPFAVPTIQELCSQINQFDAANPHATTDSGKKLQDYKKTKLKDFMSPFLKFLEPLESNIRDAKLMDMDKDGMAMDW
ncbi:primase polypeptide 1 [Capsaspora owczarzaki ATCC 30864]|uniref:DNA primase n=1 Tax=Capsaspora owczarzaki (strain ATCC 30864) TaxID=595528 RepID=A0A0D2VRE4_CAPO3|nr:primase polypeptide 1 [Capsaspora owczarzaki ATCC 30864]KJE93432.1 primase polypeptide 1 [Capsaspora owczarzaki ATCC 30864]|eukprot:XP_004348050.1 primase polypeptide 1 [Capsaspora owczarzaki ATCC 30864]